MDSHVVSGVARGATIIFLFGVLWLTIGLATGRRSPLWLRGSILLAGLLLAALVARLDLRAVRLSRLAPPLTAEQQAIGKQVGRRFGWITGLEGGAIVLAVIILNVVRRPDYILSTIALIVGLHFFPLAGLFASPFYCLTGLAGCAIGVAGYFVADPRLRASVVGLSFGLLLWLTVAALILRVPPSHA